MLRKGFGAVDSAFETCVTIIDVLCGILSILRHAGGRFVGLYWENILAKPQCLRRCWEHFLTNFNCCRIVEGRIRYYEF